MASLFEQMPGMGNYVSTAASNTVKAAKNAGGSHYGNLLLYLLLILTVVLIFMMLRGFKFNIDIMDIFRSPRSKALKDGHLFWKDGTGAVSNLVVTDEFLPDNMNVKYTYHFDLLLSNTRNITNIEGPYRHIFHRGSDELAPSNPNDTGAPTSSSQLPPYGLPKRLNPGVFLDPNTNDILVFVDTKSNTGDVYRESGRIVDVPMDKPIRITVSVHNQVLEVDLNCKLELTKVLAGEPKPVENEVYGICGPAAAVAAIQNLFVWPYAIRNDELKHFCPMPFPPFQPPEKSCGASTDPTLLASQSPESLNSTDGSVMSRVQNAVKIN
jgi:hypothetical protein